MWPGVQTGWEIIEKPEDTIWRQSKQQTRRSGKQTTSGRTFNLKFSVQPVQGHHKESPKEPKELGAEDEAAEKTNRRRAWRRRRTRQRAHGYPFPPDKCSAQRPLWPPQTQKVAHKVAMKRSFSWLPVSQPTQDEDINNDTGTKDTSAHSSLVAACKIQIDINTETSAWLCGLCDCCWL